MSGHRRCRWDQACGVQAGVAVVRPWLMAVELVRWPREGRWGDAELQAERVGEEQQGADRS